MNGTRLEGPTTAAPLWQRACSERLLLAPMSNALCNLCKNTFDTLTDLVRHLRVTHQVLPHEETSVGQHLARRTNDYPVDDACPLPAGHDPERRHYRKTEE